jgi:hypothetical protein
MESVWRDLIQISRHGKAGDAVSIVGAREARGVIEEHPDRDVLISYSSHPEGRQVGDQRSAVLSELKTT